MGYAVPCLTRNFDGLGFFGILMLGVARKRAKARATPLRFGAKFLNFADAGFHYMVAKVISAGIVLIWNFGARKFVLFR